MRFSFLYSSARSGSRRKCGGVRSRPRASFRPRLEALEDRFCLSTLTVVNNADSGNGSLRAAIANAQNGDTINFGKSLDGQTIT